jgi:predicted ATPase with chaperone activity
MSFQHLQISEFSGAAVRARPSSVLPVARTLADLGAADKVARVHLAEALSYRALSDEIRRAA